jgi:hypothetical protein
MFADGDYVESLARARWFCGGECGLKTIFAGLRELATSGLVHHAGRG